MFGASLVPTALRLVPLLFLSCARRVPCAVSPTSGNSTSARPARTLAPPPRPSPASLSPSSSPRSFNKPPSLSQVTALTLYPSASHAHAGYRLQFYAIEILRNRKGLNDAVWQQAQDDPNAFA